MLNLEFSNEVSRVNTAEFDAVSEELKNRVVL